MRGARRHAKEEGGLTAAHRDGEVENDCTPGVLHEHWSKCAQAAIADYVGDIIHTVTVVIDWDNGTLYVDRKRAYACIAPLSPNLWRSIRN